MLGFRYTHFIAGCLLFAPVIFIKRAQKEKLPNYIQKIKYLIIPLYLWNLFYALLTSFLRRWGFTPGSEVSVVSLIIEPIRNGHQFSFNLGSWFVIPLFMIQVLNVNIRYVFGKMNPAYKEHFLMLLCLLWDVIAVRLAQMGYRHGWWLVLVRMLFFTPFFGAGVYYKKILEKWDRLSNLVYFGVVFAMQLIIILRYAKVPSYTVSWCNDFYEGPILPFVVGFLGIAFWLRVARILEPSVGRSKTVNIIADNTFSIMVNQFLGFFCVNSGYAVLRSFSLCSSFSVNAYKSNIFYNFHPSRVYQTEIIYILAGIIVPILMQYGVDHVKRMCYRIGKHRG